MSLKTLYDMGVNSTHRVRAWGRGHANHISVVDGINPAERSKIVRVSNVSRLGGTPENGMVKKAVDPQRKGGDKNKK